MKNIEMIIWKLFRIGYSNNNDVANYNKLYLLHDSNIVTINLINSDLVSNKKNSLTNGKCTKYTRYCSNLKENENENQRKLPFMAN